MYLFHDLLSKKKIFQLNCAVESQHLSNRLSKNVTFSLTISHEKDTFKIILTYYIYYLT